MTWLCLCMKWFSHIFSRSRFVHLQDAQYIYIYTETERHLMHLITNSWPQCKHMQGQRVKWLEQNLTSLKPTQTSALQLYSSVFWNKYDATLLLYELVCSMTQIWASFNMHIILTLDPVFYRARYNTSSHLLPTGLGSWLPQIHPQLRCWLTHLSSLQRRTEAYLLLTRTVHGWYAGNVL
jgi:hypothetical protein